MILQALKEYYDRKASDPDSGIAPEGFEQKEIPFVVVIKPDGQFVNLEDTREKNGNRMIGKVYLLPKSKARSGSKSYATTFLLWDHIGYLFGQPENDQKAQNQHKTWLQFLQELPDCLKQDAGVQAILNFYSDPNQITAVKTSESWADCIKLQSCNMTFRLAGDPLPIPCRVAVQHYVQSTVSRAEGLEPDEAEGEDAFGLCLITGERGEIARTHTRTPINKDTKSLVAFQKNSGYDSYGKQQCHNAPISKSAEFAYTTGLNTLLKSSRQRIRVGDAATVFWSKNTSTFEQEAPLFFDEPRKDDPDQNAPAVQAVYTSIWNGAYVVPDDDTKFYVLGLSPNSARISVRYWQVSTIKEIGTRFKQHVDDLAIIHGDGVNPALPVRRLLHGVAPLEDDDNLPANLGGDLVRAILEGLPYPLSLLQAVTRRVRAEQSKKDKKTGKALPNVSYPRAALIKACINRANRFKKSTNTEELKVSLDLNNKNIGYRLGRLFAALEKLQSEANPGLNATIRDKFYGAASSTPVTVFGNLMRLKNHHLAKLENGGRRVIFERLLAEIISGIDNFPGHLNLEDQGRFAIGYYHQMQDFYTKKTETNPVKGE
ncbi:MAG TPA: type I-C CRISPR-associated protein Cas8c/Csd1 [Kiritimatiellia bacterium]|nr:type I-C CRISPR-associated protein Cas8c/Csd1 [Kiritimatiellia bacterium]HMP33728.1 type I-C CRISPR-associated protein Cas8c/Csd1 [Kiritimatiellia bacterium]